MPLRFFQNATNQRARSHATALSAILCSFAATAIAQTESFKTLPLEDLSAFQRVAKNWQIVGAVEADLSDVRLMNSSPGQGILLCQPTRTKRDELFTRFEHADVELECEIMVPIKSNSGLYFQSRYEIQILDSWGADPVKHSDIGGIYHRWDKTRPQGEWGFEGHPPRVNAARAPGEWQQFKIKFRAPRFDAKGNKTENARFEEVRLNGKLLHESVELFGPTRSAALENEAAYGPLMIQGDHGPVALRNIRYRGMVRESNEKKVLIVTGQNNHHWPTSSVIVEQIFDKSPIFEADVLVSPSNGQNMTGFVPPFADYDLVCLDYNGDSWSRPAEKALESFVKNGGGLVVFHAADNSFPEWKAYNEMIGLGGWKGRNEKDGPYVYWKFDQFVHDYSAGKGGGHGRQVEFNVVTRAPEHPIMKGMPTDWRHARDELYRHLRGPAKNMEILASALQDESTGGSGRHEPVLMTINYGKGRVFHSVMGHVGAKYYDSIRCKGFIATLLRGAEWAATGDVTQRVPPGLPKSDSTAIDTNFKPRPEVLIIGDSISMGYTEYVAGLLNGEADVTRPKNANGGYLNCEGTTKGVAEIDDWLAAGDFDVITFNFGLHDLKRVHPETGRNSRDPNHPQQADLATYKANLETITDTLLGTGAALVFVSTTPFPEGVGGPLRNPEDVAKYNEVAFEIMNRKGIAVQDLHQYVRPRMEQLLPRKDVHFLPEGNRELGERVANSIRKAAAEAGW